MVLFVGVAVEMQGFRTEVGHAVGKRECSYHARLRSVDRLLTVDGEGCRSHVHLAHVIRRIGIYDCDARSPVLNGDTEGRSV